MEFETPIPFTTVLVPEGISDEEFLAVLRNSLASGYRLEQEPTPDRGVDAVVFEPGGKAMLAIELKRQSESLERLAKARTTLEEVREQNQHMAERIQRLKDQLAVSS